MIIVINAFSARLGGGQTYLKNLLAHLPRQSDLEIVIYAPDTLSLPKDPRIRRGTTNWPTENPYLRTLWEQFALPRILLAMNAHVLFCPGGVVTTRSPAGCKVVTMFRNILPFDQKALARIPSSLLKIRLFILRSVMLRSMANADLTIFISDYARNIIETLTPLQKAVTISHGISAAFRTHGRSIQRPAWLPKNEYLLYVSRFDAYKHQFEVVIAYAALPSDLRCRYKLLLVGEADNTLAHDVADFIQENGLDNQVVIVGPIVYEELPAVYHHAAVNLFASSCENCPNILLEILGAGRPVMSSEVMPMPEFGGDAAAYFDPTDSASIRDEMMKVLCDEPYRTELATAAVQRSADFDWAKTSSRTWQSIADLATE